MSVEVQDPEGKPVVRKDAPVSAMGTVQGDVPLAADAALGYYSIQIHFGENEVSGGFWVEEYKKPEYEVRVTPDPRRVLQGTSVKAVDFGALLLRRAGGERGGEVRRLQIALLVSALRRSGRSRAMTTSRAPITARASRSARNRGGSTRTAS